MAGEAMVDADVKVSKGDQHPNRHAHPRNIRKRKRPTLSLVNLSAKEKEAHVEALQKELDGLFQYYKEVKDQKVDVELSECASRNAVIAVLMEESELPLSRLLDQIYNKLKEAENGLVFGPMTYASVKSSLLFVGQRVMYGVPNADADVLEDDSESCFWCWETRDVKLIPISVRKQFTVRRTCRRKIHERIIAVSGTAFSCLWLALSSIIQDCFNHLSFSLKRHTATPIICCCYGDYVWILLAVDGKYLPVFMWLLQVPFAKLCSLQGAVANG